MMRKTLGFFDGLFLSFFSSKKIAQLLASVPSEEAIRLLQTLKPGKSVEVISNWSEKTRIGILNNLGDYCIHMLRIMEPAQQSFYIVKLCVPLVKKFAAEIPYKKLSSMMAAWGSAERLVVFAKLPQGKAAKLFGELPIDNRVELVVNYKPWIGATLMEGMKPEGRAEILERVTSGMALDLFDRLDRHMKADVLPLLSEARAQEIAEALRPKVLAEIVKNWSPEQVHNLLSKLGWEHRANMIKHLADDQQYAVLPLFPRNRLHEVIEHVNPPIAAKYLFGLEREDRDAILKQLHPDVAGPMRKLMLVK
jgi:Mg/Co/Ni transporter MgtE